MASIEIKGVITSISNELEKKGGFKCREVVIHEPNEKNPKYSNDYMIQVTTDKYPLIDKFRAGTQVKASTNVTSKGWKNASGVTNYYASFSLWKIENMGSAEYSHSDSSHNEPQFSSEDESPF